MIIRDEFYTPSALSYARPAKPMRGFGFFITDIIGGIASVVGAITGGNKPATQPAPPAQTVTVNVPPPPPESPWETTGGVLAIVGTTAVVSLLIYNLGKD